MTKAERAEYKAWLASLKPGDEATVVTPDARAPRIMRVKWASRDRIFMDDGRGRGCGMGFHLDNGRVVERNFHGPHMLVPVTDSHRFERDVQRARSRLYGCSECRSISDTKAMRIVAILDEPEPS